MTIGTASCQDKRAEQDHGAHHLHQEAWNGLEGGNDLLLDSRGHLLQARGDLAGVEIMEEGEILPLHRLVALPLDGGRHADAERMRSQRVDEERGDRHGRKDQQAEEGQQRPFTARKADAPCCVTPSTMTESPQTMLQIDGLDRHGAKRHHNQHAAKHRDEMQEDCHRPLGRQWPVGNIERPDQAFEWTIDRI